jgi:hypothetical protein
MHGGLRRVRSALLSQSPRSSSLFATPRSVEVTERLDSAAGKDSGAAYANGGLAFVSICTIEPGAAGCPVVMAWVPSALLSRNA